MRSVLRWRGRKGDFAKLQPLQGGDEERHGGLAVVCGVESLVLVKVTIETMVRFSANARSWWCDVKNKSASG